MPLPSGFEWIVILVIALLILGPGKLPDVAAAVGKSIREFRKASSDVQDAVKLDAAPQPAGGGQPPAATPAPVPPAAQPAPEPTPQTSEEPTVKQPIAPVAPAASAMPPVVTAPEEPEPVADSAPTDVAPKADG
ncbi:MAG: twin-arginine translocase TatA/TatE family subunit [Chloroflexota bacterium]